jgi:hypothetical protein
MRTGQPAGRDRRQPRPLVRLAGRLSEPVADAVANAVAAPRRQGLATRAPEGAQHDVLGLGPYLRAVGLGARLGHRKRLVRLDSSLHTLLRCPAAA